MSALNKIILLVEDDPNDRLFFGRAAKKTGVSEFVRSVADGQEAIDYIGGEGAFADRERYPFPSLVVLDLKLPLATGFEVLASIRAHAGSRYLPVVVMTSSDNEADVAQAYALGANGFMVKPASPENLVGVVNALKDFWLNYNLPPPPAAPSASAAN